MPSLGQLENGSTALANTNIANNPATPAPTNQYANPNPTPTNLGPPGGFNLNPGNPGGKFNGTPPMGPVIANPTPSPGGIAAYPGSIIGGPNQPGYATAPPGLNPQPGLTPDHAITGGPEIIQMTPNGPIGYPTAETGTNSALSALGQPGSMSANSPVSPTVGLLGIGNFASPQ